MGGLAAGSVRRVALPMVALPADRPDLAARVPDIRDEVHDAMMAP
ncbi:hypothetical protein KPATCC21470_8190 [Kitasatospora purpeofusca]